jgi:type VI protein secretion system component VasK
MAEGCIRAGLDDEKRTQVWGTTFNPGADPVDIAKDYAADFALLQNRLHAEMIGRLPAVPDPA